MIGMEGNTRGKERFWDVWRPRRSRCRPGLLLMKRKPFPHLSWSDYETVELLYDITMRLLRNRRSSSATSRGTMTTQGSHIGLRRTCDSGSRPLSLDGRSNSTSTLWVSSTERAMRCGDGLMTRLRNGALWYGRNLRLTGKRSHRRDCQIPCQSYQVDSRERVEGRYPCPRMMGLHVAAALCVNDTPLHGFRSRLASVLDQWLFLPAV